MFRFNNPDALLVLLLVGAAYATLRGGRGPGARRHPVRWLALGGALVGLGVPHQDAAGVPGAAGAGAASTWSRHPWRRKRLGHLLVAFGAMVLAAGWWIAIVELWPASQPPVHRRLAGQLDPRAHPRLQRLRPADRRRDRLGRRRWRPAAAGWGATGSCRLFNSEIGGQVAWLLPASLVLLVAGLWFTRRHAHRPASAPALVLWGGWLVVTALTFSFMAGIFHAYYTVALAPAIAALVGIGAWLLWRHRDSLLATGCSRAPRSR